MSDADVATDAAAVMSLVPEFEPPAREAWLALVEKVLKGGDFEKRLVARTADGLALQPLYTRGDPSRGARPPGARRISRAAGISASATANRTRRRPTPPSSTTSWEARPRCCCRSRRPARPASPTRPGPRGGARGRLPRWLRRRARRAREHHGCGRQPDRDLARAGHQRQLAPRRLQLRSARRAGQHRHALLSGQSDPARSPPSSPPTAAP